MRRLCYSVAMSLDGYFAGTSADLVVSIKVAVIPVLPGGGIKVFSDGRRRPLHLAECKSLPTGILMQAS